MAERPLTSARVRPSALTRRASTTSSASSGSRSPSSPRSAVGQLEHALDVRLRGAGRTMPGRARPPSSRSSAWASTVLPAPVSPVSTLSPGAEPQLGPLDQQEVLDAELVEHGPMVYQRAPTDRRRPQTALCHDATSDSRPNFSRRRR